MKFCFDLESIEVALRANGWSDAWHPNNWVHESSDNPDTSGTTMMKAFEILLWEKNLTPRNVDKFWDRQ